MAMTEAPKNRAVAWASLVGLVALISFAGRVSGGRPPAAGVYRWGTAIGELLTFAVIFVVVLAIASGMPKRETFALRAAVSWGRALRIMVGVLVGVLVLSRALDPLLHAGREQG